MPDYFGRPFGAFRQGTLCSPIPIYVVGREQDKMS